MNEKQLTSVSIGISGFLNAAHENESKSLQAHSELLQLLDRVDAGFRMLVSGTQKGSPLASILLVNSHASFLCAARIALSGQSPPVFMTLRGCIESALYAFIVSSDETKAQVWLNREKERDRCRKMFTASNGLKSLKDIDPNLEKFISELYNASIDFGAHPNRRSVLEHLRFNHVQGASEVELIYLHHHHATPVLQALVACVETGIASLSMAPHVLPDHESAGKVHGEAWLVYDALQAFIRRGQLMNRFEHAEE